MSQTFNFGARHAVRWITTDAPLVLDPNNPTIVYFGGNVLDRSTDRGAHVHADQPARRRTTCPARSRRTRTTSGPFYANEYATITRIAPAKTDAATRSTSGTDTGRLWKTTDLGATLDAVDRQRPAAALGERDRRRPDQREPRLRRVLRLPRGRRRRERLGDRRRRRDLARTSAATCRTHRSR